MQIIATDLATPANQSTSTHHVYLATSSLDFDRDGLPDDWEFTHGLNLADDGSGSSKDNGQLGDPDGDELVNLLEFALANNPNAHDPEPKIHSWIEVDPADGKRYFTVRYTHRIVRTEPQHRHRAQRRSPKLEPSRSQYSRILRTPLHHPQPRRHHRIDHPTPSPRDRAP